MNNWRPVDVVVCMIAGTVCLAVVVAIVAAQFLPADDEANRITGAVIGSLVAIVSLWVGQQLRKSGDDDDADPPDS